MRWHQIAGIRNKQGYPNTTASIGGSAGSNRQIAMQSHHNDPKVRDVVEAGTIKPLAPLDADGLRKRLERQSRVQRQLRDEDARHAAKKRDLNARLAHQD
jgi:hypothetical protein